MLISDPISDLLIRIKNAYAVGHGSLDVPFSRFKFEVARVLEKEEYLKSVSKKKKIKNKKTYLFINIKLKYDSNLPALNGLKILSRPSRRLYLKKNEIRPVKSGYGDLLITTPLGVMTGGEARKKGVGGQVLAEIW